MRPSSAVTIGDKLTVVVPSAIKEDVGPSGFISPHFDDVVLSCATVLPVRSVVLTVFGSGPDHVTPLRGWDVRCCYFNPGDNIAAIRHDEDDAALKVLAATGARLSFWEERYLDLPAQTAIRERGRRRLLQKLGRGAEPDPLLIERIADALVTFVRGSDFSTWFAPLGIAHMEHVATTVAALRAARELPDRRWILYEDLPYAGLAPHAVAHARDAVLRSGFALRQLVLAASCDIERKSAAIGCYRSQLVALGDSVQIALTQPERFYSLVAITPER